MTTDGNTFPQSKKKTTIPLGFFACIDGSCGDQFSFYKYANNTPLTPGMGSSQTGRARSVQGNS